MIRMPLMTVNRWRALSLKRLAHLSELQRTGRWQLHYTDHDAFELALRDADADAEKWKRLAYYGENRTAETAE
jgi:hypothetical protein